MDIQVNRFREQLGLAKLVMPRKTVLDVLKNVMLKDGKLVATNMETLVALPLPEADINCLIPYAEAVKVLQYVPGDEMLHIAAEKGLITMRWSDGNAKFDAGTKTVDDYPPVPEFAADAEAMVDVDTLILAMEDVLVYAATAADRPVLNGVALILGPEETELAAGDGFRMALRKLPIKFPKEATIILPAGSVDVLKVLCQKTPRTPPAGGPTIANLMARKYATIAVDGDRKGLMVRFGAAATAFVRLIQGTPPNFAQLIPSEEPQLVASVIGSDLDLAVRRLRNIAKEGNGIVRLVFNDGTMTVSASGDGHNAQSTIKVLTGKGGAGRVALNATYLLDYLNGKEGVVTISLRGQSAPIALRYQRAPTVLIMPMQAQWGDEPTEAAAPDTPGAAEVVPVDKPAEAQAVAAAATEEKPAIEEKPAE